MSVATAARLVVGGACVVVPARVLAVLRAPDRDDVRVQRITRLLGVRLVLQAGLAHVWGGRAKDLDIVIELTHAASMLGTAVIVPTHRRSATMSAAIATGIAVLDLQERRKN